MIVTAPSGLAGEIRSLKIKELKQLADPALARGGRNVDLMLSMFERITDPGPYKWPVGEVPVWDQVLLGDRFSLLIDIRCITFDPDYFFPVRCSEPRGMCNEGYEWGLDLRALPRKAFPQATLDQLREGANRFETFGPEGETVTFRLLTGAEEKAIEAYRRRNHGRWDISNALAQKIVDVDGVKNVQDWVDNLDARAGLELAKRMDLVDGGIDTDIEVVCPKCQWQEWISLPFGATFFVPSKRRDAGPTNATPSTTPRRAAEEGRPETNPTAFRSATSERRTG